MSSNGEAVQFKADIPSRRDSIFEGWAKLRDELLLDIPSEEFKALDDLRDTRPDVARQRP